MASELEIARARARARAIAAEQQKNRLSPHFPMWDYKAEKAKPHACTPGKVTTLVGTHIRCTQCGQFPVWPKKDRNKKKRGKQIPSESIKQSTLL